MTIQTPDSRSPRGFTLVELLVVIAIIGILVSLLLPAVQAAREAARRSQCQHNLAQLAIAINSYEMAHSVYPPGSIASSGPVASVAQGYHHGWITQVLPYFEQTTAYNHIDRSASVYDEANAEVRVLNVRTLRCPSSWLGGRGYSDYAGVHHDVEAPIDATNNGVFFLNSHLRYQDIPDGASQTFFVGEKLTPAGDLGWMSGTRATLRNTGTRLNVELSLVGGGVALNPPAGPPAPAAAGDSGGDAVEPEGDAAAAEDPPGAAEGAEAGDAAPQPASSSPPTAAPASSPLFVGGFGSDHPGGASFAMGDGSVRYISQSIATDVYQQLGNRRDGQLLDFEF